MLRKLFGGLLGGSQTTGQSATPFVQAPSAQAAAPAVTPSSDPMLGQIQLFALGFAPKGWLLCDGQAIPISREMAMFALLGTKFGGDGQLNFCLPDLRGKEPVANTAYCICMSGVFPERP